MSRSGLTGSLGALFCSWGRKAHHDDTGAGGSRCQRAHRASHHNQVSLLLGLSVSVPFFLFTFLLVHMMLWADGGFWVLSVRGV